MDLKAYLKIFKKNIFVFLLTLLIVIGIGAAYKIYKESKPVTFEVSLLLNVTRSGIQNTDNYRFDDFYRLQADERFADTVVRWLKLPRIVTNIYNETGIVSGDIDLKKLSKVFSPKRLSSQAIEVTFESASAREAQDISEALTRTINQEIKLLNQYQKEEVWFKIIGDEPVIKANKLEWKDILLLSAILGIFLGIWAVLIKHYFARE
ncbi:MAG: hypothetical protein Q7S18_01295 [bacterium]|nr:hypothetical protein [bacterium]